MMIGQKNYDIENSYLHSGDYEELLIYYNGRKASYNYYKRSSLQYAIGYILGLIFCLFAALSLAVCLIKSFGASNQDIVLKSIVFTLCIAIALFFALIFLFLTIENINDYSECKKIEMLLDRKMQEIRFKSKLCKYVNRREDK